MGADAHFEHVELANGLTIIGEVNPSAVSQAIGFFARTGSRDETPELSGVSHFLEHMLFKGTQRRSARDVNRRFDEMGANYNAATSEETTVYYAAVLPEHQEALTELLCDIMRPSLHQADFDVEKSVILEEIALYEDLPHFRVYDQLMSEHFGGHPLGNRILGTTESITQLEVEGMREYFDRRYSPANLVLAGAGSLDFDRLVDQAGRLCGSWRGDSIGRETPAREDRGARRTIYDEKLTREHLGLISPAPAAQDEQRYAAELIAAILGDTTGSRLYYALIDTGIADEASTSYRPFDRAGGLQTFVSTAPERASEALRITQEQLARFARSGPTDRELEAAKNKIATGATIQGERPLGRLVGVGSDWIYQGRYIPLTKHIEALFAVTKSGIMEALRRWDITETTVLALGPVEDL